MARNLDLTALRSFVTVADTGGVTRAAGLLNLTQSAVSMQLKRLEEALGVELLDRGGRRIALTAEGAQLLAYGKRMIDLNDEALARMTATEFEGEVRLGVPHDVIYPAIPRVLRRLAAELPRVQVRLISAPTRPLLAMFARGECEVIVTTEAGLGEGGETLVELPLVWVGAEGGTAWRRRPLPLAFCSNCIFKEATQRKLDAAGIDWTMTVESSSDSAAEAAVGADLGVHVSLQKTLPPLTVEVEHDGALPELGQQKINCYAQGEPAVVNAVRDALRVSYRSI